jgi:hypothetical protein
VAVAQGPSHADSRGAGPNAGPVVDISKAQTLYVNFCRVTGTPEEMVLDFALETNTALGADRVVVAPQRITLSHMTAKRLFEVLQTTVRHYEQSFGNVEIAVEKRLSNPRP